MKKVLSILMITIMLFSTMMFPVSADNGEISVYLDATKIEFDVKPQIINGRTMVPIRAIFEKMGAVVEWDGNTSSAICTKGGTVVKMTVNSMDMYINNQLTKMDISPVVIDGRTLAPARYVAEAFGADVQWDQNNNAVIITSSKNTTETNNNTPTSSDVQGETVYVGKTGNKYHYKDCRTLKDGAFPMSLSDAEAEGRTPCKVCHK